MKPRKDTPENRAYWRFVERVAREVKAELKRLKAA